MSIDIEGDGAAGSLGRWVTGSLGRWVAGSLGHHVLHGLAVADMRHEREVEVDRICLRIDDR